MRATLALTFSALLALQGPIPPPDPPRPLPVRIFGGIPETGESLIEGVVRRLDSGEPLPFARVNLTGLPQPLGSPFAGALALRDAVTDAEGRFAFRNLPAATYTVRVSLENYFAPGITGLSAAELTASVNTEAHKESRLTLNLVPGGTIAGSVRDVEGQPEPNVWVSALRVIYRDGRKVLQYAKNIQSDDRGEFRLWSMPPGEYYVRANGIYYPGVAEAELATLISVRGGNETSASFRILPIKSFRVSGTVVNAIPELASEPAAFALVPRGAKIDDDSAASLFPNLGRGRGQGYFEIAGVRPGVYDLMPAAENRGNTTANPVIPGSPRYYTSRVTVDVRDRDVEGITAVVTRGSNLRVHVNARDSSSLTGSSARYGLGLRSVDAFPNPLTATNMAARPLSADDTIQFLALPEGAYALTPLPSPGFYIADIRQGARSIYEQGVITVGKDSAEPVEVVMAAGGGRIEGTVERADIVSTTIRISLIPEGSRRDNLLLYRRAVVTQGRFVLTGIPAGSYKLLAWEDLPAGADENAEFMAPYENRGRAVTVRADATITDIVLPLIRK
jgi:hypothetical protein